MKFLIATGFGLYKYKNEQYETLVDWMTCTDIEQDDNGSYWISSYQGLYNYNGTNIINHYPNNSKIFQKPITKIIVDKNIKWMIIKQQPC